MRIPTIAMLAVAALAACGPSYRSGGAGAAPQVGSTQYEVQPASTVGRASDRLDTYSGPPATKNGISPQILPDQDATRGMDTNPGMAPAKVTPVGGTVPPAGNQGTSRVDDTDARRP